MDKSRKTWRRGFTLVEMMVVMGIIVMVSAMALPTIYRMFNAGADAQAYNVLSSQLLAARALAIRTDNYTCVYVRMADAGDLLGEKPEMANACYATVLALRKLNPLTTDLRFRAVEGYVPVRMPQNIAFGEISSDFVSGGNFSSAAFGTVALPNITGGVVIEVPDPDFTTFAVVFSPSGSVVSLYNGVIPMIDRTTSEARAFRDVTAVWNGSNTSSAFADEPGVAAVAMFDYTELRGRDPQARASYLNQSAQFIPINVYTGQLFPRR